MFLKCEDRALKLRLREMMFEHSITVFCCMRQDCAHWNEQIWPLHDGFGLQLLYS